MFGNRRVAWHWKKNHHKHRGSRSLSWLHGFVGNSMKPGNKHYRVCGAECSRSKSIGTSSPWPWLWRASLKEKLPMKDPMDSNTTTHNEKILQWGAKPLWHRARRIAFRAHMKHLLETKNLSGGTQGGAMGRAQIWGRSQRNAPTYDSFCLPDFILKKEWPEKMGYSFLLYCSWHQWLYKWAQHLLQ